MLDCLKAINWKKTGVFAAGVLFGTAGIKVLSSKDAKKVYTNCTAAVLRAKECVMTALEEACGGKEGFPVKWYIGEESGTVVLDKNKGELAVGILQHFLDDYLKEHAGEIDYIHDDDALIELAKKPDTIGFLLPAMEKSQLFRGVIADGVLPRKTFSMGHSREKRYYLEGRKIK